VTWVKLDDRWTDEAVIQGLTFQTRWHYLGMLSWCCRMDAYDGALRLVDALRASDVDDPAACIAELVDVGLLATDAHGSVRLTQMERHALPPHLRDSRRKQGQRERKQRQRTRDNDRDVTRDASNDRDVTRDTGVGVGSGRETTSSPVDRIRDDTRERRLTLRASATDVPANELHNKVEPTARVHDRACRLIGDVLGRTTQDIREAVEFETGSAADDGLDALVEVLVPALVAGTNDADARHALRTARDAGSITDAWEHLPVPLRDWKDGA